MSIGRLLAFLLFTFHVTWICDGRSIGGVKVTKLAADNDNSNTAVQPKLTFIQKFRGHTNGLLKQFQSLDAKSKSVMDIYKGLRQSESLGTQGSKILVQSAGSDNQKISIDSNVAKKLLQIRGGKMIKGQKVCMCT